jgi:FAD/FMN-containing dehydrogenase
VSATSANLGGDLREEHARSLRELEDRLRGNAEPFRLRKRTSSNLFRYGGRSPSAARPLDLSHFDRPLHLDTANRTLDVQGLATYERVVDFVLPSGLVPTITPELKHITVGGAVVGIGIESNSFRYGFVHDALLEADVLLPDGSVVLCSPENEHADLFHGLPNSYGTLGYVLRAKLRLRPVKPYVHLQVRELGSIEAMLDAAALAADDPGTDYLECLAYSRDRLYLTVSTESDSPDGLRSIYGPTVFYREISRPGAFTLTTRDYLFRYDPEWFWGLPDNAFFRLFRAYAPPALRHSGAYARYLSWRRSLLQGLPFTPRGDDSIELLIQDWEVPWRHAGALLDFVFEAVDLAGKPLMVTPVRVPAPATLYPMTPNELYMNLGSYNYIKRSAGRARYESTKMIDEFCFRHDGIKMLYSTTFLSEDDFDRRYGGEAYVQLKRKYDPQGLLPTLFEKVVGGR